MNPFSSNPLTAPSANLPRSKGFPTVPTIIILLCVWTVFIAADSVLYVAVCRKDTVSYDELSSHGSYRFLPGSGFYLAWKYRNR